MFWTTQVDLIGAIKKKHKQKINKFKKNTKKHKQMLIYKYASVSCRGSGAY